MQQPWLINKWTACTAQAIQHMPHGCWDRHATVSWRMINITLRITQQHMLSAYLQNNSGIRRTDSTTGYSRKMWLFKIKIAQTKIIFLKTKWGTFHCLMYPVYFVRLSLILFSAICMQCVLWNVNSPLLTFIFIGIAAVYCLMFFSSSEMFLMWLMFCLLRCP